MSLYLERLLSESEEARADLGKRLAKAEQELHRYNELDREGRLLILPPCKVGDIVYINFYGRIAEATVKSINIGLHGLYITTGFYAPLVDDLGKTWFLTREDAEAFIGGKD